MKKTWLAILGIVVLALGLTYLQILIIHWAVGLFYPISMMQAFAISLLLTMINNPFKGKFND